MHPTLENLCGPGKPLKLDVDARLVADLIAATSAVFHAIQQTKSA